MISFDERKYRTHLFGLSKTEERLRWENWIIPFSVATSEESSNTTEGKTSYRDIMKFYHCTRSLEEKLSTKSNQEKSYDKKYTKNFVHLSTDFLIRKKG
jgi:hypothetical protein